MKKRQILFSGPMVRAIPDGHKTQTRRVIKPQPNGKSTDADPHAWRWKWKHDIEWGKDAHGKDLLLEHCPYGQPGDRLWVRETWATVNTEEGPAIMYRADGGVRTWHNFCKEFGPNEGAGPSMNYEKYPGDYTMWWTDLARGEPGHSWKPSIFMPHWASRITLEVESVRVERVQSISDRDAEREGLLNKGGIHLRDCTLMIFHPDQDCKCGANSLEEEFEIVKSELESEPWKR